MHMCHTRLKRGFLSFFSLALLAIFAASSAWALEECGGTEAEATVDTGWVRYFPDEIVAPNGSQLIQFTYSSEFLSLRYAGDVNQLKADLDAFAAKLCDEIDNPLGINLPDIALLYDAYQVTEFRPYEYDDPWFDTNGGGKFLLDQDASYDIEVRGLSTFRATQAAYNHIDLVFKSSGNPHLWEVAGAGVASDENDELPPYENRSISSNGVTLRTIPIGPNWGAYATAIHELGHLMDHTAYNSTISGYTSAGKAGFGGEARAQLARRYAGIDRPVHGGYGTPFNACYYREQERYGYEGVFPEDEDAAWDHGGGRADDLGEAFWGYLVEHFDAGTSAIVSDDLAARYITATTYRNGDERFVNMYLYSMAQILGEAHYDDTTLEVDPILRTVWRLS